MSPIIEVSYKDDTKPPLRHLTFRIMTQLRVQNFALISKDNFTVTIMTRILPVETAIGVTDFLWPFCKNDRKSKSRSQAHYQQNEKISEKLSSINRIVVLYVTFRITWLTWVLECSTLWSYLNQKEAEDIFSSSKVTVTWIIYCEGSYYQFTRGQASNLCSVKFGTSA